MAGRVRGSTAKSYQIILIICSQSQRRPPPRHAGIGRLMTLRGPPTALPRPHAPSAIRWDPILGAPKEGFANEFEIGMGWWPLPWTHMEASVLIFVGKPTSFFFLVRCPGIVSELTELTRSRCEGRRERT